jgi:hypothetical protein
MSGVRTELVFESAPCPVAEASREQEEPLREVTWTAGETVTEQVVADEEPSGFEEVFDYGEFGVYEFERGDTDPCPCEAVGESLGPVMDVVARDGELHVTLHAAELSDLRERLVSLRERFGDVRIEYLVRNHSDEESDVVPVDLGTLTDRQREVLERAHSLGYFEYPRETNATEVAETLDIQPSTFTEHLARAQGKLLDELL